MILGSPDGRHANRLGHQEFEYASSKGSQTHRDEEVRTLFRRVLGLGDRFETLCD